VVVIVIIIMLCCSINASALVNGSGEWNGTGNAVSAWYNYGKDTGYLVSLYCYSVIGNPATMDSNAYELDSRYLTKVGSKFIWNITNNSLANLFDEACIDYCDDCNIIPWEDISGRDILDMFTSLGVDYMLENWFGIYDTPTEWAKDNAGPFYTDLACANEIDPEDVTNFEDSLVWFVRVELEVAIHGLDGSSYDSWDLFSCYDIGSEQGNSINFLSYVCKTSENFAWMKSDGTPNNWTYYYSDMDESEYSEYYIGRLPGVAMQSLAFSKMPNTLYMEYDMFDEQAPADYMIRDYWSAFSMYFAGTGWKSIGGAEPIINTHTNYVEFPDETETQTEYRTVISGKDYRTVDYTETDTASGRDSKTEGGTESIILSGSESKGNSGTDSWIDYGSDSWTEKGTDYWTEYGSDSDNESYTEYGVETAKVYGSDTWTDSGTESFTDSGTDELMESGTDRWIDTGTESGINSGSDTYTLTLLYDDGIKSVSGAKSFLCSWTQPWSKAYTRLATQVWSRTKYTPWTRTVNKTYSRTATQDWSRDAYYPWEREIIVPWSQEWYMDASQSWEKKVTQQFYRIAYQSWSEGLCRDWTQNASRTWTQAYERDWTQSVERDVSVIQSRETTELQAREKSRTIIAWYADPEFNVFVGAPGDIIDLNLYEVDSVDDLYAEYSEWEYESWQTYDTEYGIWTDTEQISYGNWTPSDDKEYGEWQIAGNKTYSEWEYGAKLFGDWYAAEERIYGEISYSDKVYYGSLSYGDIEYGVIIYGEPEYLDTEYGDSIVGEKVYEDSYYGPKTYGTISYGSKTYTTTTYGTQSYGTAFYGSKSYDNAVYGKKEYSDTVYGTKTRLNESENATISAAPSYGCIFDHWEIVSGAENIENLSVNANSQNISFSGNVTLKAISRELVNYSIQSITPNAAYREGSEVITSFTISTDTDYDILPGNKVNVTFTVDYSDGKQNVIITKQTKAGVVMPAEGENLVWFKWLVPEGTAGTRVFCTATIEGSDGTEEKTTEDNVVMTSTVVSSRNSSDTPDTTFESSVPAYYLNEAAPNDISEKAIWKVWEYDGTGLVEKTYGISVSDSVAIITPDSGAFSSIFEEGQWIMRSGYGITIEYKTEFSIISGIELPSSDAYTDSQYVCVYYPEFNYSVETCEYSTLEKADGVWQFVENINTNDNDRLHFTPLWFPDGEYIVYVVAEDIWTPAGMIRDCRKSNTIVIDGSVYDDWYIGR